MKTYTFGALFEPGDEGGVVVTFPDVPEIVTDGHGETEAMAMAADALALALLTYLKDGRPLPEAEASGASLRPITVDADDTAKIAVLEAFRDAGISKSELARRLGKDEREVRRILDPMHATKLPALTGALAALGRRLVVGVESIAA